MKGRASRRAPGTINAIRDRAPLLRALLLLFGLGRLLFLLLLLGRLLLRLGLLGFLRLGLLGTAATLYLFDVGADRGCRNGDGTRGGLHLDQGGGNLVPLSGCGDHVDAGREVREGVLTAELVRVGVGAGYDEAYVLLGVGIDDDLAGVNALQLLHAGVVGAGRVARGGRGFALGATGDLTGLRVGVAFGGLFVLEGRITGGNRRGRPEGARLVILGELVERHVDVNRLTGYDLYKRVRNLQVVVGRGYRVDARQQAFNYPLLVGIVAHLEALVVAVGANEVDVRVLIVRRLAGEDDGAGVHLDLDGFGLGFDRLGVTYLNGAEGGTLLGGLLLALLFLLCGILPLLLILRETDSVACEEKAENACPQFSLNAH